MCKKKICLITFVLVLSLAGNVANADMSDGLLVWHDFDDLLDGSGNGHDAVLSGDAYISGGLLYLDGTEDYADIGTLVDFGPVNPLVDALSDFTIAVAYACTSTATGDGGDLLVSVGPAAASSSGDFSLGTHNDGQYIDHWYTGAFGSNQSGVGYADGTVHLAIVTYEEATNTYTFYHLDGGAAVAHGSGGSLDWSGQWNETLDYGLRLGSHRNATLRANEGINFFPDLDGQIDMFAIWNRALATSEMPEIAEYSPGPAVKASKPYPADGAEYGHEYVYLSWTPGIGAVEHDVYFGTSFDDVNDATASEPPVDPYKGRQTDTSYGVTAALVPGTTYYWRIDEVNDLDPESPYKGRVWSFWLRPLEATNPSPPDGQTLVLADADLSWTAGFQAIQHEVFLGTDPCALASIYKFTEPTCDPGTLLKDTTYYWQVKEYGPPPKTALGPIWSFSTVPYIPITDPNLVGWWKLDGDALDYSGYDHHGIENGNPEYVTGYDGQAIEFDRIDDYIDCGNPPLLNMLDKLSVATWVKGPFTRDWERFVTKRGEGDGWALRRHGSTDNACFTIRDTSGPDDPQGSVNINDGEWHLVVGTWDGAIRSLYVDGRLDRADADTGTMVATIDENVIIGAWMAGPGDVRDFAGITLDDIRIYNKALSDKEIKVMAGLSVATDPNPYDTETGVSIMPILTWAPGAFAADIGGSHVFFSSDKAEVEGRSETVRTIVDGNSLPVATLDFGTTYYWAVDTVNDVGPDPCMWPGDVWSFTVVEYLVVDDMEDYADRMAIITVWRDGYKGPGFAGDSGANVTVSTESDDRDPRLFGDGPPWPVRDSEAMQFAYDNDGSITLYVPGYAPWPYSADANYYSEAKAGIANLPIGTTNWTVGDVKVLTLWFYGDAGNAIEPMWVKLADQVGGSGKVTYGHYGEDPNDLKDPSWQEWNIALSDFGVDLTQVKDISIGFGDESNRTTPGGSGVVFFDDIRLYVPRCVLSLRSPDFARVDYVKDCVVDHKEVDEMAEYWLEAVPYIEPIPIDNPGFEDSKLGDGEYNYQYPGWGYFANGGSQGSWNPGLYTGDIGYGGNAPEGQNVGWANPGGVGVPGGFAQVLTTPLTADTTYKLIVEVGNTLGYPWRGYTVQLLAGGTPGDTGEITVGTLLAEDANSLTIATDTFETSTVTYTYNPALHSHLLGEPLQIRLLSLGNVAAGDDTEADFDNVRLFQTSERVNLYDDTIINFRDFAVLADRFLEEDMFP